MLVPGTWTWGAAVPVVLTAAALVLVPGVVAVRLLGARPVSALCAGPAVSTAVVAGTGVLLPFLHVRWGLLPLCVAVLLLWLVSAALGTALRRRWPLRPAPPWPRGLSWAVTGGVLAGGLVVGSAVLAAQHSPEAFPQQPDTIYHLADAQWMIGAGTTSSLEAGQFQTPTWRGFYPSAFHAFTATTSLLTGAPVVVSTSAVVLVVACVVWPLGCIALATTVLGRRPSVAVAAGFASGAFTAFPYQLMGYGVLWPNLLGQSLVPSVVASALVLLGTRDDPSPRTDRRWRAALVAGAGAVALVLAHPNAFLTAALLVAAAGSARLLGGAARWARASPGRPRPGVAVAVVSLALLLVAALGVAALRVSRVASMAATGRPGPSTTYAGATHDVILQAVRPDEPLVVAAVLVLAGAVALALTPGARWVLAALLATSALWWANVAVDDSTVRGLTWPWYNDTPRLQAMVVVPAVLALTAVVAWASDHLAGTALVAGLVAAALGATALAGAGSHERLLDRFLNPPARQSWASPEELKALRTLSSRLPRNAVVAANPWTGSTYLYVVSGRRLLVPTEKTNYPGDVALLSLELDRVGTDPAVCRAALRRGVRWALTGGEPAHPVTGRDLARYRGVDAVGRSDGWRLVARAAPYALYERVRCAT